MTAPTDSPRSAEAEWSFPGKVLILDNDYESVRDAIDQLIQAGVPVAYWDGSTKRLFRDVRTILLDINLAGMDFEIDDLTYYYSAVEALHQIKGAALVVILSTTYDSQQPQKLRDAYREFKKIPYAGFIADEGISKDELQDTNVLIPRIRSALAKHDFAQLVLLWELVLDNAKDETVSRLIESESGSTLHHLLRILERDWGASGLGRELVSTLLRILARFATSGNYYDEMARKIREILDKSQVPQKIDPGILSLLMYYNPTVERTWTGDIYRTGEARSRQYAIVMTPSCDFSNDKVQQALVSYGFDIDDVSDPRNPIFVKDPKLVEISRRPDLSPDQQNKMLVEQAKAKYVDDTSRRPERFFVLRHFPAGGERNRSYTSLCFDFQDVESITNGETLVGDRKWIRVARLDTPYIDLMLKSFGAYSSRLGVPEINIPATKLNS
jgi:hypothetical protein